MDPISIILGLSQFAPALVKWATGSSAAEKVAEKAIDIAKVVTGTDSYEGSIAAFKQDPSLAIQFQQAVMAQEKDFEQMYIDDKKDARARDVALSSTPHGNVRANYLAGTAIFIVLAILGILVFKPADPSEFVKGALTTILGVFLQQLNNIYAFEFGTTRRSREKTDVIDSLK